MHYARCKCGFTEGWFRGAPPPCEICPRCSTTQSGTGEDPPPPRAHDFKVTDRINPTTMERHKVRRCTQCGLMERIP